MKNYKRISLIVVKNTKKEWTVCIILYAIIFAFFMFYHDLRGRPYSLFTVNKCLGITSVLFISFSVVLGPMVRLFRMRNSILRYRRPLGVVSVCLVFLHVIFSLFFLPKNFPIDYFLKNWLSTLFCMVAFPLLILIAAISNNRSLKYFGKRWKYIQKLSYLALALVLVHFTILGKINNWIKWLKNPDPIYPPGTMGPFLIGVLVLLLWLIDLLVGYKSKEKLSSEVAKGDE